MSRYKRPRPHPSAAAWWELLAGLLGGLGLMPAAGRFHHQGAVLWPAGLLPFVPGLAGV